MKKWDYYLFTQDKAENIGVSVEQLLERYQNGGVKVTWNKKRFLDGDLAMAIKEGKIKSLDKRGKFA